MATAEEIANQALLRVGAQPLASGEWATPTQERSVAVVNSWPFIRKAVLRDHPWNVVTRRNNLFRELFAATQNAIVPEWDFASTYKLPENCLRVLEVDTSLQWRVERAAVGEGTLSTYTSTYPLVVSEVLTVITTGAHGLTTGDLVYLTEATETDLEYNIQPVEVTNSTTFTLPEVDTDGFTSGSTGGTVAKVTLAPAIVTDATGELGVRFIEDNVDTTNDLGFDSMLDEALVLRLAAEIVERVTDSTTKRELLLAEYQNHIRRARHLEGQEQSESEFEEDSWISVRW